MKVVQTNVLRDELHFVGMNWICVPTTTICEVKLKRLNLTLITLCVICNWRRLRPSRGMRTRFVYWDGEGAGSSLRTSPLRCLGTRSL